MSEVWFFFVDDISVVVVFYICIFCYSNVILLVVFSVYFCVFYLDGFYCDLEIFVFVYVVDDGCVNGFVGVYFVFYLVGDCCLCVVFCGVFMLEDYESDLFVGVCLLKVFVSGL